jgi:hypothetical protein
LNGFAFKLILTKNKNKTDVPIKVREKVSGGIGGGVHCLFAFGSIHLKFKNRMKRRNQYLKFCGGV